MGDSELGKWFKFKIGLFKWVLILESILKVYEICLKHYPEVMKGDLTEHAGMV